MLRDVLVFVLIAILTLGVAVLVARLAPHWVEQLPSTTTTTAAAGAVWPSKPRNALGGYGDSLGRPGQTQRAL